MEVTTLTESDLDPDQHNVKHISYLKDHLTTLGEMKNVVPSYDEDFFEALYMAVQK